MSCSVRFALSWSTWRRAVSSALCFEASWAWSSASCCSSSGDIDHSEYLTRLHVVTDIDANVGQISGDFGEQIRLFERCERRVGLQPPGNRDAARMHADVARIWIAGLRSAKR